MDKLGQELRHEREQVTNLQHKLNKSRDLAEDRHETLVHECREKELLQAEVKELEEQQQAHRLPDDFKAVLDKAYQKEEEQMQALLVQLVTEYGKAVAEAKSERQLR